MSSIYLKRTPIARNDSWRRLYQQRLSNTPAFPYESSGFIVFLLFGLSYLLIGIILILTSAKLQEHQIDYSDCVSPNGQPICSKELNLFKDLQAGMEPLNLPTGQNRPTNGHQVLLRLTRN
uniref:Cell cycle control protein 50C n=1 Tax=Schistocephalus solidus TaxID=70667 RepID=A0A0X3P9G5_SCHSO